MLPERLCHPGAQGKQTPSWLPGCSSLIRLLSVNDDPGLRARREEKENKREKDMWLPQWCLPLFLFSAERTIGTALVQAYWL